MVLRDIAGKAITIGILFLSSSRVFLPVIMSHRCGYESNRISRRIAIRCNGNLIINGIKEIIVYLMPFIFIFNSLDREVYH